MNLNKGYFSLLPKEIFNLVLDFVDTSTKIKIKSTNKFFQNPYSIPINDLWDFSHKSLQKISKTFLDKLNPVYLKKLNLTYCSELINLNNFTNLQELAVNLNKSTIEIPHQYTKLTKLIIIQKLPTNINNLINLKSLRLELTLDHSNNISNLINLEEIEVLSSKISLSENLTKLTKLIILGGKIMDTTNMTNLTNLKYLHVNEAYTISFTANCTNLELIDAEKCILDFPQECSKLTKLIIQDPGGKDITNRFTNLKILTIKNDENKNEIYNLTKLEKLSIGRMPYVTQIPPSFINLTMLSLWGGSNIKELKNLISLESLIINTERLTNLENLPNLTWLRTIGRACHSIKMDLKILTNLKKWEKW